MKTFPGAKAKQLKSPRYPVLEDNAYNMAVIHVGINNLLSKVKPIDEIYKDITYIGRKCV